MSNFELMNKLVSHPNIQLNVQEKRNGDTPLMNFIKYELRDGVELRLAQPDCDLSIKNNAECTAEDLARDSGLGSLIQMFERRKERDDPVYYHWRCEQNLAGIKA